MPAPRIASPLFALLAAAASSACAASSGKAWVNDLAGDAAAQRGPNRGWSAASDPSPPPTEPGTAPIEPAPPGAAIEASPAQDDAYVDGAEPPIVLRLHGTPRREPQPTADGARAPASETFRNTYYDFPTEAAGPRARTLYDAACAPIAAVTEDFHDRVCVQGSGRLASGDTVSFAARGCACAAVCPRTGQQICFERLDPARFPSGRGATGRPITPLRTVAVDTAVIPLGTLLYIPELAGLPRADGSLHDGCFLAEDRGIKVVGRHVDVFTGDPAMTARWNALVPSNRGVRVLPNDPRCAPPAPRP